MRTIRCVALAGVPIAVFAAAGALAQRAATPPSLRVDVTRVELVSASPEAVEIHIFVEAQSERATKIRSFSFHSMRANGMPAYMAPAFEQISIPSGDRVTLGPFKATFYSRDLNSLAPIRRLIQDANVRVEGTSRVEIELDWIEQLALWARRGVIWHDFDQTLEVGMPGGFLRQLSAVAVFTLAEPLAQAGLELRRTRDQWFDQAWQESIERVAAVRSTYAYRRKGEKDAVTVEMFSTGLFVSPERLLVSREALEPWRFDPATAYALDRGEIELAGEREVEAMLPGGGGGRGQTLRFSAGDFTFRVGKCDTERVLLLDAEGRARRVKVCSGSGEQALASLELAKPLDPFEPSAARTPEAGMPLELAVLRLIRAPGGAERWWEIVRLSGERVGGEIRLARPIDRSALGSPLLLDGVPVGILLTEHGGPVLPGA